ncbi:hypothetical protein E3U43_002119 [Larimichthys crocea]|uniref:Uncharacterized protein n=1 Tax=Larimichthys crocea TaxID=215358 RepID=A0ACD3QQN1_LARCR|nr:hypothetical protein E3U43_002119 [Larimichthys crocea]
MLLKLAVFRFNERPSAKCVCCQRQTLKHNYVKQGTKYQSEEDIQSEDEEDTSDEKWETEEEDNSSSVQIHERAWYLCGIQAAKGTVSCRISPLILNKTLSENTNSCLPDLFCPVLLPKMFQSRKPEKKDMDIYVLKDFSSVHDQDKCPIRVSSQAGPVVLATIVVLILSSSALRWTIKMVDHLYSEV